MAQRSVGVEASSSEKGPLEGKPKTMISGQLVIKSTNVLKTGQEDL